MELQFLDIVPRSLRVLVNDINMLPFMRKGEKVPHSSSKAMPPQVSDETRCCFTIFEGEDLEDGLPNVKTGEVFLRGDVSRSGDKVNCTFNLNLG